jgi:hypothetical protein
VKRLEELRASARFETLTAYLSILALPIFACTVYTALHFPLYPDEVAVRNWHARHFIDSPFQSTGHPFCAESRGLQQPWVTLIPGIWHTLLHGWADSPTRLREIGVVLGLFLAVGLGLMADRQTSAPSTLATRHRLLAKCAHVLRVPIAIIGLGVFPIFWVTNRNEQVIFLGLAVALALHYGVPQSGLRSRAQQVGFALLLMASTALILTAHPKGLFLTPFLVVLCLRGLTQARLHRAWHVVYLTSTTATAYGAYSFFKTAFACSNYPQFERMVRTMSLDLRLVVRAPRLFLHDVFDNLTSAYRYVQNLGFREGSDVGYLPVAPETPAVSLVNLAIHLAVLVIVATAGVTAFRGYVHRARARQFGHASVLPVLLLLAVIVSIAFNVPKVWYDAGYVYALTALGLLVSLRENHPHFLSSQRGTVAIGSFLAVSLFSQVVFVHRLLPEFMRGFAGPGIALVHHDQDEYEAELSTLDDACRIDPESSSRLVVDDYTYWHYKRSRLPMAITYIEHFIANTEAARRFVAESDSDGVVVRCDAIPSSYSVVTARTRRFCCIAKSDLPKIQP